MKEQFSGIAAPAGARDRPPSDRIPSIGKKRRGKGMEGTAVPATMSGEEHLNHA